MNIRSFSIKKRLYAGFSLIMFLMLLLGISSIWDNSRVLKVTKDIYSHPFVVSNAVRDIKTNVISIQLLMERIDVAPNELEIKKIQWEAEKYEKEVYDNFDLVLERFLGDKEVVRNAKSSFEQWKLLREEIFLIAINGKAEEAAGLKIREEEILVRQILNDIEHMSDFAKDKANDFFNEVKSEEYYTNSFMIIFLIGTFIICLIIIFHLSQSILKPIKNLNFTAHRIESGDLNARSVIDSKDELGMLSRSFNTMTDSVQLRNNVLKGVKDIAACLHGVSEMDLFTKRILSSFVEITGSQLAVFYLFDSGLDLFEPVYSIGAEKASLNTYKTENIPGDIGNVLHTQSIYYLRDIENDNYLDYKSVAGKLKLKEIVSVPILVSDSIAAIISCGKINNYTDEHVDILKQSQSIINASFSTLIANRKIKEYSEKLVVTNEELEMQSEELQEQSEELREQSDELRKASENLHQQNIELEIQKKEVEEANRLKSEFLSNMSHELRTPLNSINALSKVLYMQMADSFNKEERNYLQIIERNGKRLLSLINDILDLSKVESGKMEIRPTRFSLSDSLAFVTEGVKSLANEKGIALNYKVEKGIEIESDEGRLQQVFTNLIGNAIKFTEKGKVDISCDVGESKLSVTIQDTGIGIDKDFLPYIFQEFRQGDGSTTRLYEGTGLGLSISKKIIERLNGNIFCTSTLGVGSSFTVELPLTWHKGKIMPLEKKTELVLPDEEKTGDPVAEKNYSLMIVEDNETTVVQVARVLTLEGFDVHHAKSGEEALGFVKNTLPDCIILDLMMPGMDGFGVLEHLRSNKATKAIPVLLLTAKTLTSNDMARLASYNVTQVIHKGDIDEKDLIMKVKFLLKSDSGLTELKQKDPNRKTKYKLAVIEDNPDGRTTLKALLGSEYTIVEAEDGEAGLQLIKEEVPDLVLLDISLPKKDGMDLIRTIRNDKSISNIQVIAVTAKAMKYDKEKILQAGCNDYISKPIDQDELFIKLKRYLPE